MATHKEKLAAWAANEIEYIDRRFKIALQESKYDNEKNRAYHMAFSALLTVRGLCMAFEIDFPIISLVDYLEETTKAINPPRETP